MLFWWRAANYAGVGPVGKIHQREDEDGGEDERPKSEGTCVERQKEDAGTNTGAKKCDDPRQGGAHCLLPVGFLCGVFGSCPLCTFRAVIRAGLVSWGIHEGLQSFKWRIGGKSALKRV